VYDIHFSLDIALEVNIKGELGTREAVSKFVVVINILGLEPEQAKIVKVN
jgi:hypothetical protein